MSLLATHHTPSHATFARPKGFWEACWRHGQVAGSQHAFATMQGPTQVREPSTANAALPLHRPFAAQNPRLCCLQRSFGAQGSLPEAFFGAAQSRGSCVARIRAMWPGGWRLGRGLTAGSKTCPPPWAGTASSLPWPRAALARSCTSPWVNAASSAGPTPLGQTAPPRQR